MTNEEVKKMVSECGLNITSEFHEECMEKVLSALKKQIPKKPKCSGSDEQDTVCCPVCSFEFGTLDDITFYNIYPSFCGNCGQAIWWGEENE